jgi:transcriptional regulator with XRE-family HTH domain
MRFQPDYFKPIRTMRSGPRPFHARRAQSAGVAATTVSRYENGADAYGDTLAKLQRALEAGGIVFLSENGEGPGVRLKKR